jgi:hypothetical protein
MLKKKQAAFYYIEKARIEAGFFISEACEKLGIGKSTWYRWKAADLCPEWALAHMELLAGNLYFLGWKNWRLQSGVLYRTDLNTKYYNWMPADLMISVFCDCEAHKRIRAQMRPTDALRLPSGNSDNGTGFSPVVLVAESQNDAMEGKRYKLVRN